MMRRTNANRATLRRACTTAVAIASCAAATASAATQYSVTNLGLPSGFTSFSAGDINSAGVVTGTMPTKGSATRGAIWRPDGAGGGDFTLLPTGAGAPSWNYTS